MTAEREWKGKKVEVDWARYIKKNNGRKFEIKPYVNQLIK